MLSKTTVYDLKNYRLNRKDDDIDEIEEGKELASITDKEIEANYQRKISQLKDKFTKNREEGPIQTTQLVMLAHKHDHFFIFLLKDRFNNYSLPTPSSITCINDDVDEDDDDDDDEDDSNKYYKVDSKELVSQWWRPHFDDNVYPYAPVHVATPVEQIKVMLAELPVKCRLVYAGNKDENEGESSVDAKKRKPNEGEGEGDGKPSKENKKIVIAVPFYDIFANEKRFGPIISSLPQILSSFGLPLK